VVEKQLELSCIDAAILRLLRDSTGPAVGRFYLRNYFKFSRYTGEQGESRKSRSIRNRFVITIGYE
jgi:hypothetical protein